MVEGGGKRVPLMRRGAWRYKAAIGVSSVTVSFYCLHAHLFFSPNGLGPDIHTFFENWFMLGIPIFLLLAFSVISRLSPMAAKVVLFALGGVVFLETTLLLALLMNGSSSGYPYYRFAVTAAEAVIVIIAAILGLICMRLDNLETDR